MSIFEPVEYQGPKSPAPAWISFGEILGSVADAVLPPSRITVDKAAAAVRRIYGRGVWQGYDNDRAPYMVEPQQMITRRSHSSLCFVGPARSSKSAALIENPIAHSIAFDPKKIILYQMSVDLAKRYSDEVIGPMIANSPELAKKIRRDNQLVKEFAGGGNLAIGWPAGSQTASVTAQLILLTDYDKMTLDVEGEGSMFKLASFRSVTEGSRAMTVVESSPRRRIQSENWKASTPHEAPPAQGIASIYNEGTRARFYYTCPQCGGEFEPKFDRLDYDREAETPDLMGREVVMICPHSGCVITQDQRRELNLKGRWLHETEDGDIAPFGKNTREAATLSYWLTGPCAWATTWSDLVIEYEKAKAKKETLGDDSDYQTVMNTRLGLSTLPTVAADAEELDAEDLKAKAIEDPVGVAPEWTRFVVVAADTQKGKWVWQAVAVGADLERQIIDRGEIFKSPDDPDRMVDPARQAGDWEALQELREKTWPIGTTGARIRASIVGVDMQGEAGVTERARAFWKKEKRKGRGDFWQLIRGRGGDKMPKRAWRDRPESASKGQKVRRDVPILNIATDKVKNDVYAGLSMDERGPRAVLVPRGHAGEVFDELASERSTEKGWRKKAGVTRNEAFDLMGYATGLIIILGAEKIEWTAPPPWAEEWRKNSHVDRADVDEPVETIETTGPTPKKKAAMSSAPKKRRRSLRDLARR